MFRGKKYNAVVRLLDGDEFSTEVTKGTTGRDILDQICKHVGLDETDFFGLKYVCPKDRQLNWIDNLKTIGKQMGNGPYHLVFRVKFYPPNPSEVRENITRYQIVLQLRDDLLKERLVCSVPIHALLASYLVQAEKGDYEPSEHGEDYIDGLQFMPNQGDDFLSKVHEFHTKHKGLTPADAEYQYLENARKIPLYGMDLHDALDGDDTSVVLGVSQTGVHVILKGREISKFSWSNIHKVYFKSKRFYLDIRVVTEVEYEDLTVGFKCRTRTELKRLYRSAIDHHTFFRCDIPVSEIQKGSFFRLGSRFRYSGRNTFQQLRKSTSTRTPPSFQRVSSQRFASSKRGGKVNAETVKDSEEKSKDGEETKQSQENDAKEDDGSPYISRDAVVMPSEQGPAAEEQKAEQTAEQMNPMQNNVLAVTITISPPTPVPAHRQVADDNGAAAIEKGDESTESYEVIELKEEESAADTASSADSQPPNGSIKKNDKEENDAEKPAAEETVSNSEPSQDTAKVVTSTTTVSHIITETEIITVNELNEETVIVEEHVTTTKTE